jgi:hypothetical protein
MIKKSVCVCLVAESQLVAAIKEEFHQSKDLAPGPALDHAREVAERGLSDLLSFSSRGGDFSVQLKGATGLPTLP